MKDNVWMVPFFLMLLGAMALMIAEMEEIEKRLEQVPVRVVNARDFKQDRLLVQHTEPMTTGEAIDYVWGTSHEGIKDRPLPEQPKVEKYKPFEVGSGDWLTYNELVPLLNKMEDSEVAEAIKHLALEDHTESDFHVMLFDDVQKLEREVERIKKHLKLEDKK